MTEDAWLGSTPRWITCERCGGSGKSAGGDCPNCRINGIPVGLVRMKKDDDG